MAEKNTCESWLNAAMKFLYQDYRKLSLKQISQIAYGCDAYTKAIEDIIDNSVKELLSVCNRRGRKYFLDTYEKKELYVAKLTHELLGIKFDLVEYDRARFYEGYQNHDCNLSWGCFIDSDAFNDWSVVKFIFHKQHVN